MGPRMRLIAAAGATALTVACLAGLLSGCGATVQQNYDAAHRIYNRVSASGLDYAADIKDGPDDVMGTADDIPGAEVRAACAGGDDKELTAACRIAESVKKTGPVIRQASLAVEDTTNDAGETEFLALATRLLNDHIALILSLMGGENR